jgi:hypothetical protein
VVALLVQLEVVGQLLELELDIVVEQLVVPPIETVFEPVVDTVELLLAVVQVGFEVVQVGLAVHPHLGVAAWP